MGKITFILGGARSGKSQFAVRLAKSCAKSVVFVATAIPFDKEMTQRVALHRKNRPCSWKTLEEPRKLSSLATKVSQRTDLVIIDCLTLFISNLLLEEKSESYIENEIHLFLSRIKKNKFNSLIVSNEVGMGIVPDNKLSRRFRDLSGKINQKVAKISDEVYFIVAGQPIKIKGS